MPSRSEELYGQAFGDEALARQREIAKTLWPCCGEPRAFEHHIHCSKRPADPAPAVVEGQESLL